MSDREHPDDVQSERDELAALLPLDDAAGPAHRLSSRAADELIERVLVRAAEPAAADVEQMQPALKAARRRRRRSPRAIIVLIAAVALVGVASASVYMQWRDNSAVQSRPAPAPQPPAISQPAGSAPVRVERPAAADEHVPRAVAPTPPAKASDPRPRRAPRRSRTQLAEDFLRQANAARRVRRWSAANRLYRRARRRSPGSTAAYVATVASAALELEKLGHARRALSLYRAALRRRPHGSLAHEARWGVAEAARALRDRALERRALREFVARHPRSPIAARARARLRELGK